LKQRSKIDFYWSEPGLARPVRAAGKDSIP